MADSNYIQYFLGANSPAGFYSLYDQLLPAQTARSIYILKGGPGCGKSTLMHAVAQTLSRAGAECEYILCSGDPASLDAVVFPGLKAALVDGTAPHAMASQGHRGSLSGTSAARALKTPVHRELESSHSDRKRATLHSGASGLVAPGLCGNILIIVDDIAGKRPGQPLPGLHSPGDDQHRVAGNGVLHRHRGHIVAGGGDLF